jgi:hypothetical protein
MKWLVEMDGLMPSALTLDEVKFKFGSSYYFVEMEVG